MNNKIVKPVVHLYVHGANSTSIDVVLARDLRDSMSTRNEIQLTS